MIQNDKYFHNWTAEDFEWGLNGKAYVFKAGSVSPMTQAEFNHFAKHLTDRELNKADFRTNDQIRRAEFLKRCEAPVPVQEAPVQVSTTETTATTKEPPVPKQEEEFADLKKVRAEAPKSWCDTCSSKGRVHKLGCPKRK